MLIFPFKYWLLNVSYILCWHKEGRNMKTDQTQTSNSEGFTSRKLRKGKIFYHFKNQMLKAGFKNCDEKKIGKTSKKDTKQNLLVSFRVSFFLFIFPNCILQ